MQKHDASHLHYDFRLELDGVLLSWAVPKGPDLDPAQKRLAMRVEDHPTRLREFRGDHSGRRVRRRNGDGLGSRDLGADGRSAKGLREGHLKFQLHGEKLRGGWMLVRRGGKSGPADERTWFLFKERDPQLPTRKNRSPSHEPLSVATGRDLDEIAAEANRVWGPEGEVRQTKKKAAAAKTGRAAAKSSRGKTSADGKPIDPRPTRGKSAKSRPSGGNPAEDVVAGVRLTHPDKVLYPEQGLTKLDLAHYYQQVSEWMLPYVVGRPLALVRCPGGRGKPCFFQKHPGEGATNHLSQVDISLTGQPEYNLAIKNEASLIELVQMGVLEIHVWGSLARRLEKPDRLIFDLDPDPSVEWPGVVAAVPRNPLTARRARSDVVSQDDRRQGTAHRGADPAPHALGRGESIFEGCGRSDRARRPPTATSPP